MGRTGRVAGCYSGWQDGIQRRYDPEKLCTLCGCPAAWRQTKCHDCICEASVNYLPDPITIALECAKIRKEWSDLRYNRGVPPAEYEIPTVREPRFQ